MEATPEATQGTPSDTVGRPKKARRTELTQNACTRCRLKKSKCNGKRPTCGRCITNGAECVYDVAQEGITKMQNLQQQLDVKTRDLDRLTSLFDALYQATEIDASALLWQLRQGDGSIDSILALAEASQTRSMSNSFEASTGSVPRASVSSAFAQVAPPSNSSLNWNDRRSGSGGPQYPTQVPIPRAMSLDWARRSSIPNYDFPLRGRVSSGVQQATPPNARTWHGDDGLDGESTDGLQTGRKPVQGGYPIGARMHYERSKHQSLDHTGWRSQTESNIAGADGAYLPTKLNAVEHRMPDDYYRSSPQEVLVPTTWPNQRAYGPASYQDGRDMNSAPQPTYIVPAPSDHMPFQQPPGIAYQALQDGQVSVRGGVVQSSLPLDPQLWSHMPSMPAGHAQPVLWDGRGADLPPGPDPGHKGPYHPRE